MTDQPAHSPVVISHIEKRLPVIHLDIRIQATGVRSVFCERQLLCRQQANRQPALSNSQAPSTHPETTSALTDGSEL